MELVPAPDMTIIVLCPTRRPDAHCLDCPASAWYIPPQPGEPGDWSAHVTDLDHIRQRFPGVRFHHCLAHARLYGVAQANAIFCGADGWSP